MLGGNLKLTAYVVVYKLLEKLLVLVGNKVIKPDSRTDKHLFNFRQSPQLLQKLQVVFVGDLNCGANRGG